MFKIDIIVPTFNRPKLLNRCLNSIKKSYSKNFRIIVIDDGSSLEELVDKKPTTTKSLIKNKFDKFVNIFHAQEMEVLVKYLQFIKTYQINLNL